MSQNNQQQVWSETQNNLIQQCEINDNQQNIQMDLQYSANDIEQMQQQFDNVQNQYYPQQNYDDYYYQESLSMLKRQSSVQKQFPQLLSHMKKQVQYIMQIINFNFDWAFYLYYFCKWNMDDCRYITDPKQNCQKLINYNPKFQKTQGYCGKGDCEVCGESNANMIRNICGHQFCEECWAGHMEARLTQYFNNPFPPCIKDQSQCEVKMSLTVCELLANKNPKLYNKFVQVLCRSYASFNPLVKICQGKPQLGINCNQCFTIKNNYEVIECKICGNMVCPRCGSRYHGGTQCYELQIWKSITQDGNIFQKQLVLKTCPFCKLKVQRKDGCNFMTCKCKKNYCYVCEKPWQLPHKEHTFRAEECPFYKSVKQLEIQKQKSKLEPQKYSQKKQQKMSQLESLVRQYDRLDKFKIQKFDKIKKQFLKNFNFYGSQLDEMVDICAKAQKIYCVLWSQYLSFYYKQKQSKQFMCDKVKDKIDLIYDFLFQTIEKKYNMLLKDSSKRTDKENQQLTEQNKAKFLSFYLDKIKDIKKQFEKLQQLTDEFIKQSIDDIK